MLKKTIDIHQIITDKIVAAIEAGAGDFVMPWHRKKGGLKPRNILTGNFYQGVNVLALWVEAQANGFSSNLWGTYRQWSEKGAQVRKGAKSSYVVFYRQIAIQTEEDDEQLRPVARATPVFNADQVDSWSDPQPMAPPDPEPVITLRGVDTFITATGAKIEHGGDRACYSPSTDTIHMPERSSFIGSPTSSPTEAYYSTLCHELTHYTGAKNRCDRDLSRRFGSQAYAMEELVAELGAAFLCAELGISSEPRPDHAQYIASWLQILKNDKRGLFTAASAAGKAVDFLRTTGRPSSPQPTGSDNGEIIS
ncbi:ArdC family protein [Ensifer aridi]|uniref:ArdC family protein n=1 Tax=Ensifer aridi TaxID=1708715 RepID=UPI00041933A4|nr:zincin-like metallopeptidase domain-containing protein [Ensifer aridi]